MRWVAFICFFFFSTAALALDDCNAKFPNISQLEDRLRCLQSNNKGLQSQLDALKAEMEGPSAKEAVTKPEAKPVAKPGTLHHKAHTTVGAAFNQSGLQESWHAVEQQCQRVQR